MFRRSIVVFVIFTLLASLVLPAYAVGKSTLKVAKVLELKGDVQIHKKGLTSSFKAFKGMSLSEGDIIKTGKGASLKIMVDEYKDIQLSENSRLDISTLKGSLENKNDQTKLQLWNGKVWVDIKKSLNVDSKFEIKTPTSIAGVRGTKFFVGYENEQLDVGVLTGRVETEVFNYEVTPDGDLIKKNSVTMLEKNETLSYNRTAEMPDIVAKHPLDIREVDTYIQEVILSNPEYIQYLDPETLKTENLTPELSEIIKRNNVNISDIIRNNDNTPGKPAETPGSNDDDPGKPAETPGSNDNTPGKPAEIPGQSNTPDKLAETPGQGNTPGKPAETPGTPAETPSNGGGHENGVTEDNGEDEDGKDD